MNVAININIHIFCVGIFSVLLNISLSELLNLMLNIAFSFHYFLFCKENSYDAGKGQTVYRELSEGFLHSIVVLPFNCGVHKYLAVVLLRQCTFQLVVM